jgi:hypothetical protein
VTRNLCSISYAQLKHYRARLKQLLYLRLMLMVVTGFTVVNVGATVLGGYLESRPLFNPFAAWVDALLGQPRSVIDARSFACPMSAYNPSAHRAEEHCYLKLTGSDIAEIDVFVSHGFVRQIYFKMPDNALKVKDLLVLWGTPAAQAKDEAGRFDWPSSGIAASTFPYMGRFSPLASIRWVYFTDTTWQQ